MSEKSILEMVGGEKHINPHYNIKAEKKGVTMFEKEAEDSFNCKKVLYKWETDKHSYIDGYIDSAEPREKQIQIDAEQIRALQKQKGELTDKVKELEAQIEKMKRCEICKHYQGERCNYHSNWVKDCKENGMKLFELKEIKEK